MSEHYECPFCGQVRETKKRMDFHLQYGHADLYPLMKRETTSVDLERKLDELREKKTLTRGIGAAGPPLIAMKSRYPDKAKLRAQIWDATVANPNTIMPLFGRHRMLTEEQIEYVCSSIKEFVEI